jgi:hypothetical protein
MNLIKRVLQGVALAFSLILLIIIGVGGAFLKLGVVLAEAFARIAMVGLACWLMEDPDDE